MVHSNKILTVSYGTFSCTLEGFEDSFGTMKAIAEYFRDLAAQDRYFGAEPPQPDAEMLARIAEREIARRVEARLDGSGIVLRARDTDMPAPAATIAATHAAPVEATSVPQATAPQATAPETTAPDDNAIAAFFADGTAEATDTHEDAEPLGLDEHVAEIEPEFEAEAVAPPRSAAPAAVQSAADSIAAKLQRIRAVVAQTEVPPPSAEFSEDEHAEDPATASVAAFDEADEPEDSHTADRVQSILSAATTARATALTEDEVEDDFNEPEAPAAWQDEAPAALAEPAFDPMPETPEANPQARVVKVGREEFEALMTLAGFEISPEDDVEHSALSPKSDAEHSSLSPEDEADLMRELAAVEAEMATEAPATPHAAPRADDADEEDDILSIFEDAAELEEDRNNDEDDIDALFAESEAPGATAEPASEAPRDRAARAAAPAVEDDITRLLAETDSHLGGAEASSRRSDFDHLRAAVAASKAETAAGGLMEPARSDSPYRLDLAQVVRPRRPEPQSDTRERSRRPEDQRPAPLKLVAAQRVDAAHATVRPRRVMSQPVFEEADAPIDGVMSFPDFAERAGAVSLHDLLEAAASYLSFIEGRSEFSRPQLMSMVRGVDAGEFSRKDGLRFFGQLLRDGKIEKTQGGRFAVSDRIGFRPEDLRAAG